MIEAIYLYNITLGILGFLVVILGYTTFNLLRKNEKAEDIIISQNVFIEEVSSQIEKSEKRLEEIDERGDSVIQEETLKIIIHEDGVLPTR